MYHAYFDLFEQNLKASLGENTEYFHEIHCTDPFDEKNEFLFTVVALDSNGLCLVLLENGSEGVSEDMCGRLEYACLIFRSYFFTKIPVRTVFVFRTEGRFRINPEFMIYDLQTKEVRSDIWSAAQDLSAYVHGLSQVYNEPVLDADRDELSDRLLKESSEPLIGDSEDRFCHVKRGGKWYLAFHKEGDAVFNLALFGGLFGLHRFYLGLPGSGLAYLFTFGFFGVGWLFDCIEMVLGCWQHKGIYLMPLKSRAKSVALLFGVVLVAIAAISISMS